MRARSAQPMALAEMAAEAGFSPAYFDRLFRAVTGLPPGIFQGALRMEEAKRLILADAASVTEICYALGYESLGTFTTRFTEAVGVAPGRLRETLRRAGDAGLLEQMHERSHPWPPPPRRQLGVAGTVRSDGAQDLTIFIGLYPRAIPRGRPVKGQLLSGLGDFRIAPVPDGRYVLLAAAFPRAPSLLGYVQPGDTLRVGMAGPIEVSEGRSARTDLALRPLTELDPPILMLLPLLAAERLSLCTGAQRNAQRAQDGRSAVGLGHDSLDSPAPERKERPTWLT